MKLSIETEHEADGRWIAEVPELPGVLAYGMTQWPSVKAQRVLAASHRIGRRVKRQGGSHRTLERDGWPDLLAPRRYFVSR